MTRALAVAVLSLATACGSADRPAPPAEPAAAATPAGPSPERVLTAPGNVELWLTDAREGRDSTGATCTERVMEVRRDGRVLRVPLLYTGDRPTLVNDSTAAARLWLNCAPVKPYWINLVTGQPIPR